MPRKGRGDDKACGDVISDDEVEKWDDAFDSLAQQFVPSHAAAHIDRILDEAWRDAWVRPAGIQHGDDRLAALPSKPEGFLVRGDVQRLSRQLFDHIEAGHASMQLMASWRSHVNSVWRLDDSGPIVGDQVYPWRRELEVCLRREFGEVDLECVGSLGRDVASATFVANGRLRIVLGLDAFLSDDGLEAQFRAYHMCLHSRGGLPRAGYTCWLDYKRDVETPALRPILENGKYRQDEAYLNDTAAALMFDDYVATKLLNNACSSLLRGALPWAERLKLTELYQTLAGPAVLGDERLVPLIWWTSRRLLSALIRPRLEFFDGSVEIVRQYWWSPIYLVWRDANGQAWRRWVPSRNVLYALGLRLGDVGSISASKLHEHSYDGILIDPTEVRRIRAVLAQSRATRHRSLSYLRRVVPAPMRVWDPHRHEVAPMVTFGRDQATIRMIAVSA